MYFGLVYFRFAVLRFGVLSVCCTFGLLYFGLVYFRFAVLRFAVLLVCCTSVCCTSVWCTFGLVHFRFAVLRFAVLSGWCTFGLVYFCLFWYCWSFQSHFFLPITKLSFNHVCSLYFLYLNFLLLLPNFRNL